MLKNKEGEQEQEFDKVLIAIGRKPNSISLALEKAGIETDDKGYITVNTKRKQMLIIFTPLEI